ncbi:MAG: hypothetical protein KGO52_16825 [Nitrospirota bacterium]|nr:hypothetical protein [Nitrospirota bacterium]MDE3117581.1 hypothetical protein [Nitrospirota bacterium]MDE3224039.1 hypothetical protein [Nitrospirota bacterium]MDE3244367.1 hypothetical protein [Nitrospirota bacterium]
MFIEVESNPNCEQSVFVRFKEAGPARRVTQVRSYERSAQGDWCWITGWTDDPERPLCSASAQLVEDSGAGLAYLVFGGLWGVRLKPVALAEAWSLESPRQWGEPYLSLADAKDLRFEEG